MKNKQEDIWPILSIADTVSGTQARENPHETIDHYQRLQTQLWLASKVRDVADGMLVSVNSFLDTCGPKIRLPQPRDTVARVSPGQGLYMSLSH